LNCLQWLKNLLIFVPAFFAGLQWKPQLILELSITTIAFSLLASAVYLINDLRDREWDRLHPNKRHRLVASGVFSAQFTLVTIIVLLTVSFSTLILMHYKAAILGAIYLCLNILYSMYLKRIALLDIMILVMGYYIRLLMGGLVANVYLSGWLLSLVTLIAVYLLLLKRRSDVLYFQEEGLIVRPTVHVYAQLPIRLINQLLLVLIGSGYTAYLLHLISDQLQHDYWILLTLPLVVFALVRFDRNTVRFPHKDAFKLLFSDRLLVATCIAWIIIFAWVLYGK
jgi:decaprenyl-phosphate phosphoribosyltransferase